jgi:hypothetical protein
MSQQQLPNQLPLFLSPIPASQNCSLPLAMNAVQPSSVTMVRTEDLLSRIAANSTRTPTPSSQLLTHTPTRTSQLFTIVARSSFTALPCGKDSVREEDSNALNETCPD